MHTPQDLPFPGFLLVCLSLDKHPRTSLSGGNNANPGKRHSPRPNSLGLHTLRIPATLTARFLSAHDQGCPSRRANFPGTSAGASPNLTSTERLTRLSLWPLAGERARPATPTPSPSTGRPRPGAPVRAAQRPPGARSARRVHNAPRAPAAQPTPPPRPPEVAAGAPETPGCRSIRALPTTRLPRAQGPRSPKRRSAEAGGPRPLLPPRERPNRGLSRTAAALLSGAPEGPRRSSRRAQARPRARALLPLCKSFQLKARKGKTETLFGSSQAAG